MIEGSTEDPTLYAAQKNRPAIARVRWWLTGLAAFMVFVCSGLSAQPLHEPPLDVLGLLQVVVGEDPARAAARAELAENSDLRLTPMILEMLQFVRTRAEVEDLYTLLRARSRAQLEDNADVWWRWWWAKKSPLHPDYGEFKAALYSLIDPKFETYFRGRGLASAIRLDEVRSPGRHPASAQAAHAACRESEVSRRRQRSLRYRS